MNAPTPHARFSPSKLPNLERCPGWQSDPVPGPAAERGTRIHAYLANLIATGEAPEPPKEDQRAILYATRLIVELRAKFPTFTFSPEVALTNGDPDRDGTADLVGNDEWETYGIVLDWKSGRGERDEAEESLQLKSYAIGAMRRHPHWQSVLVIVAELDQGGTTEATFDRETVEQADARIALLIDYVKCAKPADYRPSDRACKYCARRTTCPALTREATAAANAVPTEQVEEIAELPADRVGALLAEYLPRAKLIERWIGALEQRAFALLSSGIRVPSFALKEGTSRYEWTEDGAAIEEIRKILVRAGKDPGEIPVMGLLSPAKVIAALYEAEIGYGGVALKRKEIEATVRELCVAKKSQSLVNVKETL